MNKLPNEFQLKNNSVSGRLMKSLCQKYNIKDSYYGFDSDCYYNYSEGSGFYTTDDSTNGDPILTYEEIKAILEPKIDIIREYVAGGWNNLIKEEIYTIEQLKTEKIAVKCTSIEQGRELEKLNDRKPTYWDNFDFLGWEEFCIVFYEEGLGYDKEAYYISKGYKIINYNQINFMANTQKPIIGYKLKNKKYLEAAKLIAENNLCEISFSERNDGTVFSENSVVYDRLKTAGILELWFDAVYESEEKTIVIGNNNVKLVINGDEIKGRDIQTNYKEVNSAYLGIINNNGEIGLGGYALYFDRIVRWIRVGCTDQNNLVSINEIESVLNLCQSGK